MTNVVPICPGFTVKDGSIADEETVQILKEAVARAERGELQSVIVVGICSNLDSERIRHCGGQLHLRLALAALMLEAADITMYLNFISREEEPIVMDEGEPA